MKHIVIAGFDNAIATAVTGIMDVFSLVGVSWQILMHEKAEPQFKVWVASVDGLAIRCINDLEIGAHQSFKQVMQDPNIVDNLFAIIVPSIGCQVEHALAKNPEVINFLKWGHAQQLIIAGNCSGNFFLAEAGLLDGKRATTHWGYKALFEARYPDVNLRVDQLITVDGHIHCAGGGVAWFDLAVYIIEKEMGYDSALQIAKAFVIDYRRDNQLKHGLSRLAKRHSDELVASVQCYFEDHYNQPQALESISIQFNVSKRTLIRRFKAALNMTPYAYLQQVRIEVSQKLLAETQLSIEQIVHKVGYEDMSSFCRLFKQHAGLTLADYRQRFAKRLYQ